LFSVWSVGVCGCVCLITLEPFEIYHEIFMRARYGQKFASDSDAIWRADGD